MKNETWVLDPVLRRTIPVPPVDSGQIRSEWFIFNGDGSTNGKHI